MTPDSGTTGYMLPVECDADFDLYQIRHAGRSGSGGFHRRLPNLIVKVPGRVPEQGQDDEKA